MSTLLRCVVALILFSMLHSAQLAPAQDKPGTASPAPSNFPAEYPNDGASVLVDSGWVALSQELPFKTRTKWGWVSSLTYGVVPGGLIAEYRGQHAELQIETRRPVFSICNVPSFPGTPALVKLHPKKDLRELDAGRLPVLGAKIGEAKQSDQVPTEAVQPENACWLLRPREDLPPGEYALMLAAENLGIFPFTIAIPPAGNPASHKEALTASAPPSHPYTESRPSPDSASSCPLRSLRGPLPQERSSSPAKFISAPLTALFLHQRT